MIESLRLCCFLLAVSLVTGWSTTMKCFQCNSWVDPDCANIQPNETNSIFYRPCLIPDDDDKNFIEGYPDFFCRKIEQIIPERDNLVRIIRRCGWIKHQKHDCYKVVNEDHTETVCQCFKDGCNNALINKPINLIFLTIFCLVGMLLKQ